MIVGEENTAKINSSESSAKQFTEQELLELAEQLRPHFNKEFAYNEQSDEFKEAISRILDEQMPEKMIGLVWDRFFYYFEAFHAGDGWAISASGANSGAGFTATPQPVFYLIAGNSTDDAVLVGKFLFQQTFLTFDKLQYFRTQFQLDSVANVQADINVGSLTTQDDAYGFRVVDNALKGIVKRAGSETLTATLATIVADTTYKIEARLNPDEGTILFFVDGEEKGILRTIPRITEQNNNLWSFRLETNEDADKNMFVQTFELIQAKDANT